MALWVCFYMTYHEKFFIFSRNKGNKGSLVYIVTLSPIVTLSLIVILTLLIPMWYYGSVDNVVHLTHGHK